MNETEQLRALLPVLDESLELQGRASSFSADTPLLGALPQLESLGLINLLAAIQERLGCPISDDDLSAEVFSTVGTLAQWVQQVQNRAQTAQIND